MSTMIATSEVQSVLDDLHPRRRAVEGRLDWVRRRVRAQLLLEGVTWAFGTICLLAAVSLAADWWLRLSLATRIGLVPVAATLVLFAAYRRLLRPLRLELEDMDVAALLDRLRPGVAQKVATVLQLPGLLEGRIQASPGMVRSAVIDDAAALDETDFGSQLDERRRLWFAGLLAAAVLLPAAFSLLLPRTAVLWAERWLLGSNARWPQSTYLAVVGLGGGDRLLVPRGEPLVLQVDATPEFIPQGKAWRLDGRGEPVVVPGEAMPVSSVPDRVSIRYRVPSGSPKQGHFTRFGSHDFRYELPPVHDPLELTITGGDDWLGPITVEPIDRPTIQSLKLVKRNPGSLANETITFQGSDSQPLFLRKTELELQFTSSVPVVSASLVAKAGSPPPLDRIDSRSYVARWTMSEPLALEIQLVGEQGGLSSKPYMLSIGLLKDREPRVTVRSSGVGPRVTPQARIPTTLRALDDFGLTQLAMELERSTPAEQESETKASRIELDPPAADEATETERQTAVALRDYALPAGTMVKLRGLAADNCAEGSQTGTSRWLSFRIVTPEELFHEILMRQRAERAKFSAALATAKSQAESLDTAVTAEDLDGLVRRHQVVERQVWQVAKRLDESLVEMKLNEVGSPQAIELLQSQVITPMRQLHSEPMAAMRRVLDRMTAAKGDFEPHVPEARDLQHQIVETMQRILEQMSQWESFVDVVNQLREIIRMQNKVLGSTEETRKKKTQGVFDE